VSGGKCAEALQEVHARNKGSQESASFRDGSAEEGAVAEMDIAAFGVWGGFFLTTSKYLGFFVRYSSNSYLWFTDLGWNLDSSLPGNQPWHFIRWTSMFNP